MLSDARSTSSAVDLRRIGYRAGLEEQRRYAERRHAAEIGNTLLLCEHPPVYTLGTGADSDHVLASEQELVQRGIEVHECDRGGEVTWHGPGQIVGYVVADLRPRGKDVHRFCRDLEEIMIRALRDFGLKGERDEGSTGVWLGRDKVGALGVHVRKWITTHGFALNVSCDLAAYDGIIPCGIFDRGVTSMERALSRPVDIKNVRASLVLHFEEIFVG